MVHQFTGENRIFGDAGNDRLLGRGEIFGGDGDDSLFGDEGGSLFGGAGADTFSVSNGVSAFFDKGADVLSFQSDTLIAEMNLFDFDPDLHSFEPNILNNFALSVEITEGDAFTKVVLSTPENEGPDVFLTFNIELAPDARAVTADDFFRVEPVIVNLTSGSDMYPDFSDPTLLPSPHQPVRVFGGDSGDLINSNNARNEIFGEGGSDHLSGKGALYGGEGFDVIYGSSDTLVFGGPDDDILSAGDGSTIETGEGRDRVSVDYGIRTGTIRVTDFERGQDKLDYLLLPQDDYGERTVEFGGSGDLSIVTVRTEDEHEIIFEITTIDGGGLLDESDLLL